MLSKWIPSVLLATAVSPIKIERSYIVDVVKTVSMVYLWVGKCCPAQDVEAGKLVLNQTFAGTEHQVSLTRKMRISLLLETYLR